MTQKPLDKWTHSFILTRYAITYVNKNLLFNGLQTINFGGFSGWQKDISAIVLKCIICAARGHFNQIIVTSTNNLWIIVAYVQAQKSK